MTKKLLSLISLLLALLLLCSCAELTNLNNSSSTDEQSDISNAESSSEESKSASVEGELRVHFLDVGQGDSIFIELPNGECMLIDASEREYANRIISFIDCLGYTKIDHLIATHPHADHIGGMETVISHFELGEVYMPEAVTDTKTFINLLTALEEKGAEITAVKAGLEFDFGGARGKFVAPKFIVDDMNNCSAVLHLSFGNRAFLLTGDAEIDEEGTVEGDIKCDVLKAGHHGSRTSSGEYLLGKAKPEIVVISCGEGNSYGHPHKEALDRFSNAGIKSIYRTDISGNISIKTNGTELEIKEHVAIGAHRWVLNISSKKVHTADCGGAVDMKEANKAYSQRSLSELTELGYALCSTCKPKE
ncbi:MAG: MBL fold metallo-hydrolase [Clostridia bacterium]|nr:MBL fold metallo-hydrolase [Clostridia bacterium]